MVAPPSVSLQDLEYAFYKAATPAADNNLAVNLGQGVSINSAQAANKYQSTSAAGTSAAAPASGVAIATLAIANAGYYEVTVSAGFAGTAEATTQDNVVLKNDTTTIGTLSVQNVANTMSGPYRFWLNVAATKNITVNVGGTGGSAGSLYKAMITATRIA
jgi:hypothetical protein